jgi:hypothetical protein
MKREDVPGFVSRLTEDRPVRWAPPNRLFGDYDGRDRTLDVFNADAKEQRRLLEAIYRERASLEQAAGGPFIVVFHSRKQSTERNGQFVESWVRLVPAEEIRPLADAKLVDEADESGPHRKFAA